VVLLGAPSSARPASVTPSTGIQVPTDSYQTVVVNRVVLDIAAPAALIWSHLPGIRVRPNIRRVPQDGPADGLGSTADFIYTDSAGKVTRHDRVTVLHWEPAVRFVARVRYLPPAPPLEIIYNVDLKESGGSTHFVMDSYTTLTLARTGDSKAQVAAEAAQRREWQSAVEKGYDAFKREMEAAAKSR
jgi:hypothetical protein